MARRVLVTEILVCTDCIILLANAELSPDRPSDLPPPLSLLYGQDVVPGSGAEIDHSTSTCEGCGDQLDGPRHYAAIFENARSQHEEETRVRTTVPA